MVLEGEMQVSGRMRKQVKIPFKRVTFRLITAPQDLEYTVGLIGGNVGTVLEAQEVGESNS